MAAQFPRRGSLLRPDPVDRPAMGERHDPRPGRAHGRVKPGRGAPDLEQDLLHDLLGLSGVAQNAADRAEYRGCRLVVDHAERNVVALGDRPRTSSRRPATPASPAGVPAGVVHVHTPIFVAARPGGLPSRPDSDDHGHLVRGAIRYRTPGTNTRVTSDQPPSRVPLGCDSGSGRHRRHRHRARRPWRRAARRRHPRLAYRRAGSGCRRDVDRSHARRGQELRHPGVRLQRQDGAGLGHPRHPDHLRRGHRRAGRPQALGSGSSASRSSGPSVSTRP